MANLEEKCRSLIMAWSEMKQMGNHDGPCDNSEHCSECGGALSACSAHIEATNQRVVQMDQAVEEMRKCLEE